MLSTTLDHRDTARNAKLPAPSTLNNRFFTPKRLKERYLHDKVPRLMKQKSVNLIASYFVQWFDADYHAAGVLGRIRDIDRVNWIRCLPFVILHLGCLGIFVVGWSWTAVCAGIALYIVRMFAITGIYHRYFSHRTFKTSRPAQFLFALLGASSAQRCGSSHRAGSTAPGLLECIHRHRL